MYWYDGMLTMHSWLAFASAAIFLLRALGTLFRAGWVGGGQLKLAQVGVDVPLTISGLSLWGLLALNPVDQPWLAVKFLLLGAYVGFGALALRAPEREAELLWLLLALLALGGMFGASFSRQPGLGLF